MATHTRAPTLADAQRAARKASLEAELATIRAEEGDGGGEGDETVSGDAEAVSARTVAQFQAISASAEAKANPAMALSAIKAGLNLEQFKAMASAAPAPAANSPLREAMASARRLAPDASRPAGGSVLVADAKKRAGITG